MKNDWDSKYELLKDAINQMRVARSVFDQLDFLSKNRMIKIDVATDALFCLGLENLRNGLAKIDEVSH